MSLASRVPTGAAHLPVALPGRAYEVLVGRGLLPLAGELVREVLPGARAVAVVTDANLAGLHLPPLVAGLEEAGLRAAPVVVPPGEGSKSWRGLQLACEGVLAARIERGDAVLALGGGVVGDLAGFAAACVRRGVAFVQIPTSLLAMVDSSVGGKTGINAAQGKNLVGAFHQPRLVLADLDLLATLPPRELRAGYAEIVKVGLIGDAAFFGRLERRGPAVLAPGPGLEEAVRRAVAFKAGVVVRDEREEGERMLLNLGHTFAHALEAAVGYDGRRLVHGEAVAIGLVAAHGFSAVLGLCPPADEERVAAHLGAVGLPTAIGPFVRDHGAEALLASMAQDKKVSGGALTFILTRGIGQAYVARGIPAAEMRAFLEGEARA